MKTRSRLIPEIAARNFTFAALALAFAAFAASCGGGKDAGTKNELVTLISREEGSGTRSAFVELFGVMENKVDNTSAAAEITNNTAVMITSVAGDKNAIGYISLGSLNDTVKALEIDGAAATPDNVAAGVYKISRPFNIAVKGTVSPQAQDFIGFIMSGNGQDVIEKNHYIRIGDTGPFTGGKVSGKVVVAGSSSVTPVMEKLREAYLAINPGVNIEIQQSDSSTGINAVLEGVCDIGMASRELKSGETEKGVLGTTIAMDGIAVIVNNKNPLQGLSKERVKDIFTGAVTSWADIGR
ncbi:MAG: substrate-binding domain-containing protein [Treponema sp.]|jgi:phosphate transport system substrate-binding protein|nr:substrate-binding domain-containing protein [Treponema sp.]